MIIQIRSWDKYNPRKDYKHPWWFGFNNQFFTDPDFYDFTDKEKIFWIYMLCEASRYNKNGILPLIVEHCYRTINCNKKDIDRTLKKLLKIKAIYIRDRGGEYGICTESVLHITEQNITEHNITTHMPDSKNPASVFDYLVHYKKYPRKEGKSRGLALCKAQIKTQEDFDLLGKAIDNYVEHCKVNATEPRYIKHFSSFMSTWRDWLDQETGTAFKETIEERISRVIGNG